MTAPQFDDRPTGPLAALRAWWWLAVVLVILGIVVGGVAAKTRPTQYTAESRLVIGNGNLSAYQVPGFAQASEDLASNYARYVDDSSIVSRELQQALGSRVNSLRGISASPIPSSDVISVEVVATSRAAAKDGAKSVAQTLVGLTKNSTGDDAARLLDRYNTIAGKVQTQMNNVDVLSAKVRSDKDPSSALKDRLTAAQTKLALLKLQKQAAGTKYTSSVNITPTNSELNVISGAAIVSDNAKSTLQLFAVAGAIVGLVVALVLANLLERGRERRQDRRRQVGTHSQQPEPNSVGR